MADVTASSTKMASTLIVAPERCPTYSRLVRDCATAALSTASSAPASSLAAAGPSRG